MRFPLEYILIRPNLMRLVLRHTPIEPGSQYVVEMWSTRIYTVQTILDYICFISYLTYSLYFAGLYSVLYNTEAPVDYYILVSLYKKK